MSHTKDTDKQAASISAEDDATSQRLVAARLNTQALHEFPGHLPTTLEQAYQIQAASINRWPDDVAGWKLGRLADAARMQYNAERLAGPIFKSSIHSIEAGGCVTMPIYVGGFAAVEAEFVLELGSTISPSAREFSDEELIELVSDMYIGAEIASSPMAAVNQLGPTCVTADFGNNAGLLVGPPIPDWRSRSPNSLTVSVAVDHKQVGSANASSIGGGPLHSLRFLIELFAVRGIELPKGCFISTGATTGIHDVLTSSESRLDFAELGYFDVKFEAITPKQPLA